MIRYALALLPIEKVLKNGLYTSGRYIVLLEIINTTSVGL